MGIGRGRLRSGWRGLVFDTKCCGNDGVWNLVLLGWNCGDKVMSEKYKNLNGQNWTVGKKSVLGLIFLQNHCGIVRCYLQVT
mmetsp:Transcript_25047/g.51885  ORF Transcript_25047/g.51885 Transcript_25047/m.51885 type:complete len:82 (+) Transcript_25047:18-263(+)